MAYRTRSGQLHQPPLRLADDSKWFNPGNFMVRKARRTGPDHHAEHPAASRSSPQPAGGTTRSAPLAAL
ncbi:MAG: hypothetical protein ACYDEA_10430 [Candidatus Dormibacteria bacterium]